MQITLLVASVDPESSESEIEARGLEHRVAVDQPVPVSQMVAALRPFEVGVVIDRPSLAEQPARLSRTSSSST